jgi:hypothetical protein
VWALSAKEIDRLVAELRKAGWAAWYRAPRPRGAPTSTPLPTTGILSPQAKQQVRAFDAGRDGLAGNRVDSTWRPKIKRRWSYILKRPVPRV